MVDNYIKIFNITFEKTLLFCDKIAVKLLEKNRNENRNFYKYTYKSVENELEEKQRKLYIYESKFLPLIKTYNHRSSTYLEGHWDDILPNEIYIEFNKLKGLKKEYNFQNFIIELAQYSAYGEALVRLNDNRSHYEKIYNGNAIKFFKLVKTIEQKEIERLEQYLINKNVGPDPKQKKPVSIDFKIKIELKKRFESKAYQILSDFINEDETSYDDFMNVFLEKTNTHKSTIQFTCETRQASYLLYKLNEIIFDNLTQTSIGISKIFISKDGKEISQPTLSRTRKRASSGEKNDIDLSLKDIMKNNSPN